MAQLSGFCVCIINARLLVADAMTLGKREVLWEGFSPKGIYLSPTSSSELHTFRVAPFNDESLCSQNETHRYTHTHTLVCFWKSFCAGRFHLLFCKSCAQNATKKLTKVKSFQQKGKKKAIEGRVKRKIVGVRARIINEINNCIFMQIFPSFFNFCTAVCVYVWTSWHSMSRFCECLQCAFSWNRTVHLAGN